MRNLLNLSLSKAFLATALTFAFFFTTFSLFGLICFYDALNIASALILSSFACVASVAGTFALLGAAKVLSKSQDILFVIRKTAQLTPCLKRSLSSYPPLYTYFGTFFFCQADSALIFLNLIVDNLISLILSYGG